MIAMMHKMLAPLQRRVGLMVSRAVIVMVNDTLKMQGVQVNLLADVTRDGVERFQNYGFTSSPHPGAEAIVVSVGGNQDHCVAIAVDDRRYRLVGLAEGEAALYDDLGQKVHLTRNGIVIDGANLPITIQNTPHVTANTAQFTISGDLVVQGKADVTGNVSSAANLVAGGAVLATGDVSAMNGAISMSGMKITYNGHTHVDPQGGSVAAPTQQM